MTTTAVADAYFQAWQDNAPDELDGLFAEDIVVHGPLGRIDGAASYRDSIAHIFRFTEKLSVRNRWIDGPDILTWFDLHPVDGSEPFPVASWLHVEDDRITGVRVTFDLSRLLQVGDPRQP